MIQAKITKQQAFDFCEKRMEELDCRDMVKDDKFSKTKPNTFHFGRVDIAELLDLIYGEK